MGKAHGLVMKSECPWWDKVEDKADMQAALLNVIPNTIAVDWKPDGTHNMMHAAVHEIEVRIKQHEKKVKDAKKMEKKEGEKASKSKLPRLSWRSSSMTEE